MIPTNKIMLLIGFIVLLYIGLRSVYLTYMDSFRHSMAIEKQYLKSQFNHSSC